MTYTLWIILTFFVQPLNLSWKVPREVGFGTNFGTNISYRPCCFVGPNLLACHTGRRCITLVDVVDGGGAEAAVKQLTWQPSDDQPAGAGSVFASLAAHPSRQELLLSVAGWGMVKVWDVHTGSCTTTVTGFDSNALKALWAGDSKVVATGWSSADGIYRILRWDLGGGCCVPLPALVAKSTGSDSGIEYGSYLACSSDGRLVAANTWPNSCNVMLWDTRRGNEMTHVFKDDDGKTAAGYTAVALDGSGRIAASLDSGTGTLRTWDIRTGRLLARVGGLCKGSAAYLTLNDAGTAALCCTAHDDEEEDQGSCGGVYDLVLGRWSSSWLWEDRDRQPLGICCTRDFGSVALWHEDGLACVWRAG